MQIALFGGRFDPVHNGHIAVAEEVLRVNAAQQVWFVPDNQHPWNPQVASADDRLAMLRLAVKEGMFVDETAIDLGGVTETLSVVREFRKRLPEHEYIFVIGSDLVPTLPKWHYWQDLQKELQFLVVARKGYSFTDLPSNCIVLEDPHYQPLEDSATRIRNFIKEGKSIEGLVNSKVAEYITKHHLYE